jgi:hypothetical protein
MNGQVRIIEWCLMRYCSRVKHFKVDLRRKLVVRVVHNKYYRIRKSIVKWHLLQYCSHVEYLKMDVGHKSVHVSLSDQG